MHFNWPGDVFYTTHWIIPFETSFLTTPFLFSFRSMGRANLPSTLDEVTSTTFFYPPSLRSSPTPGIASSDPASPASPEPVYNPGLGENLSCRVETYDLCAAQKNLYQTHRPLELKWPSWRQVYLPCCWFGFGARRFFRWHIPVICPIIVLKLALTVFTSSYLRTKWPNWLNYFSLNKKNMVLWPKNTDENLGCNCFSVFFFSMPSPPMEPLTKTR